MATAVLTTALGEAYIQILVMVCKGEMKLGDLNTEKGKNVMIDLFTKFLKLKRDDKGKVI